MLSYTNLRSQLTHRLNFSYVLEQLEEKFRLPFSKPDFTEQLRKKADEIITKRNKIRFLFVVSQIEDLNARNGEIRNAHLISKILTKIKYSGVEIGRKIYTGNNVYYVNLLSRCSRKELISICAKLKII